MIMRHKSIAAAVGVCLVLAGCSSKGEGRGSPLLGVGAQVVGSLKTKRTATGRPPFATVTAKQIDNTTIPAMQVNVLSRGGSDFLKKIAQRSDGHRGAVEVWRGSDGTQLILRNGVVVGTRGIGEDIISSDAAGLIEALQRAGSGNGERRYFVSNGDYSDTELVLSCDIENLGRATTRIVHLSFQTVHLKETCIGGANDRVRIANEYWVQPRTGTIRRSKQWVGPLSGYFELILIKK